MPIWSSLTLERVGRVEHRRRLAMKRALITGITGQDGAYLSKLLRDHGYEIYGTHRPDSGTGTARLRELGTERDVRLLPLDLRDDAGVRAVIALAQPAEVYHLASQSSVAASFEQPLLTADLNALGTLRLLEALRTLAPAARLFHASSSEIFGRGPRPAQDENTPPHPRSPYAVAKLFAHWSTINYRETYGLFACCGLLFNHESPLRGMQFVTRKICDGVARIRLGLANELRLGNLDARRDWGFAGDYVRAMWLMLQQETADDYVVASGTSHSVRDFVAAAFGHVGLAWEDYVRQDPTLLRPAEADSQVGDSSKARRVLGWRPTVSFEQLVGLMVDAELARLRSAESSRAQTARTT